MDGTISSCGFASGHRFVVGAWRRSPIGATVDVMWADPDGTRTLLAPDHATAAFVTAVYDFDRVRVGPIEATATPSALDLRAGSLTLRMRAGRPVLRLPPRPRWFTRRVEGPIARRLLGVETHGTSPTGVEEWYQARACRFVPGASPRLGARALGPSAALDPPCGFGFSEPPRRPSIVEVRPTLRADPHRLGADVPRASAPLTR